jgi:pyridoxamine 5'-phosphate oxidase
MTDPIALFDEWFDAAWKSEPADANAMTLATADRDGRPSARMVLLKRHGADGFTFYTNLSSRKAEELKANPHAALLFHWKSLRRQIRIEGPVGLVDAAQADDYFATRSRESQLGAWASDQSRPLASRAELESRFAAAMERFAIGEVPRPPGWSGYRLTPERFEFWIDRPHRLHERRLFLREGDGWQESLLYP